MKEKTTLGVLVVLLVVGIALAGDGDGAVDAEEKVETFEDVEKNFKGFVGNILKKLLPYLLDSGQNVEISGGCRSSLMRVIVGVRQLKEWAMKFIDATGKIPPGILEGTSVSLGDYDECLDLSVGKKDEIPKTPEEVVFRGQYCLLEAHRPEGITRGVREYEEGNTNTSIAKTKTFLNLFVRYKHLTNFTFKLGVCVPSTCSEHDVNNILQTDSLTTFGKVSVFYCKRDEPEILSTDSVILLCVFGFIFAIVVLGTLMDMMLRLRKKNDDLKETSIYINHMKQLSKNISLYKNAIDILSTSTKESIRCLCCIRPMVVVLVICSHTYGHFHKLHFQKFSKAANFLRFFHSFAFAGIANGSVVLDTILFIAGITVTYNRWRFSAEKGIVNLNIIKLVLLRYIRMSAAQILVISLMLLFPLMGSGPFWDAYMGPELDNCRKRWWTNLLYINNFNKFDKACLYHTWVLAVIMQFTLLSVIILWIMKKSIRYAIFTVALLMLAGIIGVGIVTVINNLPGSMAFFMLTVRTARITINDVYTLPYDHVGPFCIGLLTGYYLAHAKNKLNISRCTNVLLWCLSLSCCLAIVFGLYAYRKGEEIDQSLAVFYAIMNRNVWAFVIAWVVVACSTHHGGPVSRVVHSAFFVPLDRLSYLAFVIHLPIIYYHCGIIRQTWFMGHSDLVFLGFGYTIFSFIASFFLNIIFAQPYFAIEKYVISYFRTRRKVSFDSETNPAIIIRTERMDSVTEVPKSANGCENIAYSSKLDSI